MTAPAKEAELHQETLAVIGSLKWPQMTPQQRFRLNRVRNQLRERVQELRPPPPIPPTHRPETPQ
jgi:hypothetical protein